MERNKVPVNVCICSKGSNNMSYSQGYFIPQFLFSKIIKWEDFDINIDI